MAAPKGNKNAEKWTFEESQMFINSIGAYVESSKDCTSLEKACTELGQYEELLTYIYKKFDIIDLRPIKKAKAIIKQRIIDKGLKSEYNPTMCIFILKNNHDMKDKHESDVTSKGEKIGIPIIVQDEATKVNLERLNNEND